MCGKNNQKSVVNTCERYSISQNKWEKIESCKIKRYASSCCGIEEQNKIYLFGGRMQLSDQMVEEIEIYSVEKNSWSTLKNV